MSALTPRVAAELAEIVYQIERPSASGVYRLNLGNYEARNCFSFDVSQGPVKGVSGGTLFSLFNKTTGFALVGKGINQFSKDYVVTIRGTHINRDWLTNGHVGVTGGDNGTQVHAGFNKTFNSMKMALEKILAPLLASNGSTTVHCVGHSLGGALASLTADWLKNRFKCNVNLYTFGAPRVGMHAFSKKHTGTLNAIYRCTHGADPVPMIPLWPFVHAPYEGTEYRLDSGSGISIDAHGMAEHKSPGYLNTANSRSWQALNLRSASNFALVRLKYDDRHQASFSTYWADKISAALITLLKDAGYYTAVMAQAAIGTGLTFYDLLARSLESIAKASAKFAEQTKGLLGHMLAFARQAVTTVTELTFKFIRWVFDKTVGALYRSAREAITSIS
ncbi:pimeloyl-ACP methyl ester carboxylesterase [Rheinheimera pacifica]|uniref:lipase family protein n=1 Tax=Rheinheimera pacifica TaxID=173990 RepID=UPI0028624BD0|nr:lipase family protein [Rheinheimera pacifica]MDR6984361.1 pimeloyl-ACP methyl ester carboxylesterase [Rheinheimera pacifica]